MSFPYRRDNKVINILGLVFLIIFLLLSLIVVFSAPIIKTIIENKGSSGIGRELHIDGKFNIQWHWKYTKFHAEKIRLTNAYSYQEANMVTIDKADIEINIIKLLIGEFDIRSLALDKPFLVLDRKSLVSNNWTFNHSNQNNTKDDSDSFSFPAIKAIDINQGNIIYRDAVKAINVSLRVNSQSNRQDPKDKISKYKAVNVTDEIKAEGEGSINNQKFSLSLTAGGLEELHDTKAAYPLKLDMLMGNTAVLVNGTFNNIFKFGGMDAVLDIKGHNMANLFYLTAIPLPITPPYHLNGHLTKQGNVWGYENFKGIVGGSDLAGNLSYDTSNVKGFLKANLVSNLLDSRDLGGFIGLAPSTENAAPEQKKAAAAKKASPNLIPDVPLKLERLRKTNLDVTLKAIKIMAPNLPFKGMDVRFNLKDGILVLNPLKVILADGIIDGKIEIDANSDVPPMKMNLGFHKLSLGQFFNNTRFAKTTEGFFGGKLNLSGTGASLADVLANSNGDMSIIMSGGKISLLLIEASDLDIAQALPLFLGKDKSTKIRCGVTDFDVSNGMLTSNLVVLDTNDSLLTGKVNINLKRETISAKLDAKPKDSSVFSAQIPIVLSGKLKSPSIGLDTKKIGNKGTTAAILGSLLTPFAAILPFIEIGNAKNADCRALIGSAGK